jgi:polar amino acid transport system substrate-binding protein
VLSPFRRPAFSVGLIVLALGAASACGSSSSGSGGGAQTVAPAGSPSTTTAVGVDPKLAALVPSALKSAGVVKVATDASYAPNEFFKADNKTVQGMDVDLGEAIGAKIGVKFEFSNLSFDSILQSLGNRFDLGMSSFTDNKLREKTVTMVDYFSAGTSFMVKKGSSLNPTSVADLCGKSAAVEKGTTQLDDVTAQAKKCKLTILAFPDQNAANLALSSGRADVVLADSPVNAYAAKQSSGAFTIVGTPYGTAPYGIAVPKSASYNGLAKAIQGALQDLNQSGQYLAIMKKWGVQAGAVTSFTIDGATS